MAGMTEWDRAELYQIVREMVVEDGEERARGIIRDCHAGRLRYPVYSGNLHLFRQYRNYVSPDPWRLVAESMGREWE